MKSVVIILLFVTLPGCSTFYPPWRSPVEYPIDYRTVSDKDVTVVTMTDERRSVIIAPGALQGSNADLRVCPEPPADAADSISSYIKARLGGNSTAGEKQINGEVSYANGTATAVAGIFPRSQGIELFRDGTQALCLAWLNDIYNKGDTEAWRQDFRLLMKLSYELISREIDKPSKAVEISTQPGIKRIDSSPEQTEADTENSGTYQTYRKEPNPVQP